MKSDKCDHAAYDVVAAYSAERILSVTVRQDGDTCRIICPAGHEASLARMLYHAADAMADQACGHARTK